MNYEVKIFSKDSQFPKEILNQIENIEWGAGKHLVDRIKTKDLDENDCIIIMTEDEDMVGFTTFVERDTVAVTDFGPFIATMYVDPKYRGKGLSLKLADIALNVCWEKKAKKVYILTQHVGLYEKLGFEEIGKIKDKFDRTMRVLSI